MSIIDASIRASIFLKAADLLAGPFSAKLNAATMLAQSKNVFQAEIDAACELVDFLRFNVAYQQQIYDEQPDSADGIINRLEYRPLEGFVFAITPFNFTAIGGNLASAPLLFGNSVLWKPSDNNEPGWNSPWGRGRPGWHLECSVMSEKYLGKNFDIHGGGLDLIFPHHENEIAQSCVYNGTDNFANYWVHNGFVTMKKEKMSKSI